MTTAEQGEARRWLRYADEDLLVARHLAQDPEAPPRHVCYLAQQAAEKALKAVLIFLQIDFPKTHDLDRLRGLVPADWTQIAMHTDLAELSAWAAEARYPGEWPEPAAADAGGAMVAAAAVIESVRADLVQHGFVEEPHS